jgi:hypothetical protein
MFCRLKIQKPGKNSNIKNKVKLLELASAIVC